MKRLNGLEKWNFQRLRIDKHYFDEQVHYDDIAHRVNSTLPQVPTGDDIAIAAAVVIAASTVFVDFLQNNAHHVVSTSYDVYAGWLAKYIVEMNWPNLTTP